MANNNFDSNFSRELMEIFLDGFETNRTLTKNVDTQLFAGKFNPSTGSDIDVKRPTDFVVSRTPDGDLTNETESSIIAGKATATVQDYFTVFVDYQEAKESLEMNQLPELLAPASKRIITDWETDYAKFMMNNTALLAGDPGQALTSWDDVALGGAVLDSSGVPQDGMWNYAVNPFTQRKLASDQRSLGAGDRIVTSANERAMITDNFAGMRVMTANTLATYTTGVGATRDGTLSGTPTATYLSVKDTMVQTLPVTGFQANLVVAAGETIQITGAAARNRLNLSTRNTMIDDTGSAIVWTATVVATVTLNGSGAGDLVVTGPAIFESDGQYNTVSSALTSGDAIDLLGGATTLIQPNLFWHKQAFTVASVPIAKLKATDTVGTTEDGMQIRVTSDSDFIKNLQKIRFDFRPAYGVLNPFFAGQGFGTTP